MTQTEIVARTNHILSSQFEIHENTLVSDANLFTDVGLDSLDMVDLVAALEREFGVSIDRQKDEESLRSMRTLQDVYSFIASKFDGH